MSRIVMTLFEEHHELFPAWEWAVREGILRDQGVRLLHVDEHSDLDIPSPRRPMDFPNTPDAVGAFFREDLCVSNWIWPLVYRGRLNHVSWLFPRCRPRGHRDHFPPRRLFVVTTGSRQTELITGLHRGKASLQERFQHGDWNTDYRTVWLEQLGADAQLEASGSWVLGICLDYFSCYSRPVANDWLFEISAEQREAFDADALHFLRLLPGQSVTTQSIGGSHYLAFGNPTEPEWDWRVCSEATILERLQGFQDFLERNAINPALIAIARSVKSGYTPAKQADFIESGVRRVLNTVYGARLEERATHAA